MTKDLIENAPAGVQLQYKRRRYGNHSMAEGYVDALLYAKAVHYDVPRYEPIFGPIATRLQADPIAYNEFKNTHGNEIRAEQEAERLWLSLREFMKGPSAAEVIAKNQAAAAADQLEAEIAERAQQILNDREPRMRAQALHEARGQLTE